MRRKLLLFVPVALLVLSGSAVAGTWLWAKTAFEESWRSWLAEQRARGYTFTDAEPELGGFPGELTARFDEPAVESPAGWRWRLPDVTARAPLTEPLRVRWRAPGEHTLNRPVRETLHLSSETARGRLGMTPTGRIERGRVHLERTVLAGLRPGTLRADAVTAKAGPRRGDDVPRLPFTLDAEGLRLPAAVAVPLGRTVARAHLNATAHGRLPRPITRETLHAWRENGGELDVHRLAVDWAEVSLDGEGALTLDDELRPKGELTLAVRGLEPAIDALLEAGVMSERVAGYARMAVSALRQMDDSEDSAVTLPLRFREGKVHLGPVALWSLSPVLADRRSPPDAPR